MANENEVDVYGKSYPISFSLENDEAQPILIIDNLAEGHSAHLHITNTSKESIVFKAPSSSNERHFHLELCFRKGILDKLENISLANNNDWKLVPKQDINNPPAANSSENAIVSLYIAHKNEFTLASGSSIELVLEGVFVSAIGGTRATQVALNYKNMSYHDSSEALLGSRVQPLNVINRQGGKDIPLNFGTFGSNVILNDGVTPNEVSLRLTNMGHTPINLAPETELTLSFDTGSEQVPWALATAAQMQASTVTPSISSGNLDCDSGGESATPHWIIKPTSVINLNKDDAIIISLGNIITSHSTGSTNVYLTYKNISGYWDGKLSCVIEKSPLLTRQDRDSQERRVGIGTDEPQAKLHVQGNVTITENLNIKNLNAITSTYSSNLNVQDKLVIGSEFEDNKKSEHNLDPTKYAKLLVNSSNREAIYAITNSNKPVIQTYNIGTGRAIYAQSNSTTATTWSKNKGSGTAIHAESEGNIAIEAKKGGIKSAKGFHDQYGDILPKGIIVMWSGSTSDIPNGWTLCDGHYDNDIGKYTPDLRDRFIVGAGYSYNTKDTGGEKYVTLTEENIPAHSHDARISSDGSHSHEVRAYHGYTEEGSVIARTGKSHYGSRWIGTDNNGSHSHNITVAQTGQGKAIDITPSYYSLAFIMKK